MRRVVSLYGTTVGKKVLMAVTGLIFVLFVIGHMIGNLKVYLGPEAFNHYAEGLRDFGAPFFGHGQFLWVVRAALIAVLLVHVVMMIQLWLVSSSARPVGYRKQQDLNMDRASKWMRWGGIALFAFITYHILHLTTGTLHPDFVPGDAYHNFVAGFSVPWVSALYFVAMIALGLHLYHGVWSTFQTLGWDGPRAQKIRRPLALLIAGIVVAGNLSFPIAVLTGVISQAR
jgi:succinate dehydrogenase / fumarate reductase cytochrome b subunit